MGLHSPVESYVGKPRDPEGLVIEAWSQGYWYVFTGSLKPSTTPQRLWIINISTVVGSLIVMSCVTVANMRRGVLLHKLILIELIFGMFMGTFIFTNPPVYHWYLSVTAIFLNTSWSIHNVVAWIKNKPFLSRRASLIYIGTVIMVQPYWVIEIVANWLYFGGWSNLFVYTRPYEALFRDPWWIFTVVNLFYNIKTRYEFGYWEIIKVSPRFGVLLGAMVLSICFLLLDILAVTHAVTFSGNPDGINPFWKLSFSFKCLTDTIVLDDFKTALDRLKQHNMHKLGGTVSGAGMGDSGIGGFVDVDQAQQKKMDLETNGHASHREAGTSTSLQNSGELDLDNIDLESALKMNDTQIRRLQEQEQEQEEKG